MDILLASLKEVSEGYAYERLEGSEARAEMFLRARQERLEAIVAASRRGDGAKKADGGNPEGK
jgi:hypothetical protein